MADAAKVYLADDLVASSGRVVAGLFDGSQLALEEVYRFDNGGVPLAGRMQWDFLSQWNHIQRGLRAGGKVYGSQVAIVPREEIFAQTGLQLMEFNTLYQLLAMKLADSPLLDVAQSFLMMPDLF